MLSTTGRHVLALFDERIRKVKVLATFIPNCVQGVDSVIRKTFVKAGERPVVRVVFILPSSIWADTIYLVGDFNNWNIKSHPFQRDRDGRWVLEVELELGRAYQFRYLRDGVAYMTDLQADAYVPNPFGSDNFVVVTDPNFEPHYD
jgi:hypothetical protein